VTAVDAAAGTVTYRLSQFFQGQEAVAAAREDGRIGPNEDLPSPLYVRDLGRDERRALSPSASVMVLKPDAGGVPVLRAVPPREFLDVLATALFPDAWYGSPFYRFQVGADGEVTGVEQLYVP
jgi:hypothetical protein